MTTKEQSTFSFFSENHHFYRGINDLGIVSEYDFTCTYCYKFLKIFLDFPSVESPYLNIP